MIHKTRRHDIEQLRREYDQTPDPNLRKQIKDAARRIRNETGAIESMREALIKEHRKGRYDNVKDIHEFIKKRSKYYQSKHE